MRALRSIARSADRGVSLGALLGLTASDDGAVRSMRGAAIDEARTLWPMAAVALIGLPLFVAAMRLTMGNAADAIRVLPAALLLMSAALGGGGVLYAPPLRRLPSQRVNALFAGAMALAAAGLALLVVETGAVGAAGVALTGFVAIAGTIVVLVAAIQPVRAALVGFTLTLAAMVPVLTGAWLAGLGALLLVALLTAGTLRGARATLVRQEAAATRQKDAQLAAQLVGEFEAHGSGWFWQTDRDGNVTYLSPKVADDLRRAGTEPIGEKLTQVFRVDSELVDTERTLTFHLASRTSFSDYSVRPARDDVGDRWWSISGRPITDKLGRFRGFAGSGSDLTEKRRAEAEITRLALFDGLTGLANRQRMRLSLEQTLCAQPGRRGTLGLFLLDLDRFKQVNDTLGHQTGDALLKLVAQRLQRTVGDAGLVGRLGGDEFQVVLPRETNADTLSRLAGEVIANLSQSYFIDGSSITIGCSIGIAIAPDHGADAETLIRNADLALYAAKADGRGVHRFFRDELLAGAKSRKRLEDDLRFALLYDQFHLAYQPVVATADGRIVGYEALLRWEHPVRGAIGPADFIPVAEECGLIDTIGEWVLRTACADAARWPAPVRIAVNVSPIQFASPKLPALVTNVLAATGLAPERLELEITEGVFLDNDAHADAMFASLKRIGVRLALDDFGTGYSSLGYLKTAAFDKIKIDQSFVRGAIRPGNRSAAIIKAIVTLADTLGMETTAEGVEQQDEIAFIAALGCSHIQGFVFGLPETTAAFAARLASPAAIAPAVGHRVSRAPRRTTLRSARIEVMGTAGEVRIRNISSGGALIDGIEFEQDAVGADIVIELIEDELVPATVRWASDGRAGLAFSRAFDIDRLAATSDRPAGRVAA